MFRNFAGWQDGSKVLQHVQPDERVLDYGCGSGATAHYLKEAGVKVSGCDVRDYRKHKDFPFLLAAKTSTPLKSESFDSVILGFVLHHCHDQEGVLREATRIARRKVIVLEDVAESKPEEAWVRFFDILCNLPNGFQADMAYKTESEWAKSFKEAGLEVKSRQRIYTLPVPARKVLFVLEKKPKARVALK